MALLPALKIKKAVGGVIKLTDVPADGATALIPEPDNNFPRENVSVFIELEDYQLKLGVSTEGYYRVRISRSTLLDHIGPKKQFKYILLYDGAAHISDSINYDILHS
jgi:hypothetical protein